MNFKKIKIVYQDEIILSSLEVEAGLIKSIGKTSQKAGFDLANYYLIPGYIDQHTHGAFGFDTMDGTYEALNEFSKAILKEGTTSFLATTMTGSPDEIKKAVWNVSDHILKLDGANLLGVNLEGPFISPVYKGAQPEDKIQAIDLLKLAEWNKNDVIKIMTVAPELDNFEKLAKYCLDHNLVMSIGHSNSSYEDAKAAIKLGAPLFTHAYNAMSKLHHRDIGMVGAMLLHKDVKAELICDLIHVSAPAIKVLYDAKGSDNIILITDSMRAKWLKEGKSELGGQTVTIKNGEARLADGSLAGSVLKLNDGVKNIMKVLKIKLPEAVKMASLNPAKMLKIDDRKGSIEVGKDADLVVLDKDYNVVMTIVKGVIKYDQLRT